MNNTDKHICLSDLEPGTLIKWNKNTSTYTIKEDDQYYETITIQKGTTIIIVSNKTASDGTVVIIRDGKKHIIPDYLQYMQYSSFNESETRWFVVIE